MSDISITAGTASGDDSSEPVKTPPVYKFECDADGEDMIPIILKNLLLNIITLSLYRFWGRTNVRHYIWSQVKFMGDPLEYTGKGGEMFIGFLIVLFTIFLPIAGLFVGGEYIVRSDPEFGLGGMMILFAYLLLGWLVPFGIYRSNKYRMAKTRWRGIRGAQLKSGASYAWASMGFVVFIFFTLSFGRPLADNQLYRRMTNNRRFGSGKFAYDPNARSGPLFGAYCAAIGITIVGFIILGIVSFYSAQSMIKMTVADISSLGMIMPSVYLAYIVFLLCYGFGFALYEFKKLKYFWNHTSYEGVPFHFEGKLGGMILMYFGNLFFLIVTLGIAYPVTQMRYVRYVVNNLSLVGEIDLASIQQTTDEEPTFGEGLADGFDMGTI